MFARSKFSPGIRYWRKVLKFFCRAKDSYRVTFAVLTNCMVYFVDVHVHLITSGLLIDNVSLYTTHAMHACQYYSTQCMHRCTIT